MQRGRKSLVLNFVSCLTLIFSCSLFAQTTKDSNSNPIATIHTNLGSIKIELFKDKAPVTVSNFVKYVNDQFYSKTIFHRVIPNFMIQGGGFDTSMNKKATREPIINEAKPFVANKRGTIAMARTSDPNSATAQFFINIANNHYLNKSNSNPGYAVFGQVIEGLDVADKIANVKTGTKGHMRDVPMSNIIIESISIQ